MKTTRWTALGVSFVALFLAGCSTATTAGGGGACDGAACEAGTDAPVHGDGGCMLAIAVMSKASCTSCLQMRCCLEVNACFASAADAGPTECNLLNACETSCSLRDAGEQQGCFDACKSTHAGAVSLQAAWTDCASASCPTQCL